MRNKSKERRSASWIAVCAAVLTAMLVLPAGAAAQSSQAQFRKQYLSYLADMGNVAKALEASPAGQASYDRLALDPARAIARARLEVRSMSPAELAVLRDAVTSMDNWRSQPDLLQGTVGRSGLQRGSARRIKGISPTRCSPRPPLGITDYYIAAGVALGLEVVHVAIPDDILTSPAQIAAAAAWGVAAGTALTLEGLNAVEAECDDAKLEAFIRGNLDASVSSRVSQTSFNTFTANFNSFNAIFTALNSLVTTRLDVAVSSRASQVSLDALSTLVNRGSTWQSQRERVSRALTRSPPLSTNRARSLCGWRSSRISRSRATRWRCSSSRPRRTATWNWRVKSSPTPSRTCRRPGSPWGTPRGTSRPATRPPTRAHSRRPTTGIRRIAPLPDQAAEPSDEEIGGGPPGAVLLILASSPHRAIADARRNTLALRHCCFARQAAVAGRSKEWAARFVLSSDGM